MSPLPEEYRAVLEGAGFIRRLDRGLLALTGTDAQAFLHALLTNDIAALGAGQGCYAAYLTPQGRMITDMVVLHVGERLLLDVPGEVASPLAARLDQLIFSEDAQVTDQSAAFASIGVHGPRAATVLARGVAGGSDAGQNATDVQATLGRLGEHDNAALTFRGQTLLVAGSRELGASGFNLFLNGPGATLVDAVAQALASEGASQIGRATFDTLRIEAGRPIFGVDMDTDTIPLEAGIEDRAISFIKGCYVGQEVIIRVLHRGHGRVAKKLVGLVSADDTVASAGDKVLNGDIEIGRVTSAAFSPRLGRGMALGYVLRDLSAPGTAVSVSHGDAHLPAATAALPLIAPIG